MGCSAFQEILEQLLQRYHDDAPLWSGSRLLFCNFTVYLGIWYPAVNCHSSASAALLLDLWVKELAAIAVEHYAEVLEILATAAVRGPRTQRTAYYSLVLCNVHLAARQKTTEGW